jgi:hypothetical protein
MYAIENQFPQALTQLQAVAALSKANAQSVAADIASLQAGKNPFPASQLGALGIPQPTDGTTSAPITNIATSSPAAAGK